MRRRSPTTPAGCSVTQREAPALSSVRSVMRSGARDRGCLRDGGLPVLRAGARFLVMCGSLLALAAPSRATTWYVTYDPDQPEDRVGAAVANAQNGDTVVVGPGVFYEHVDVGAKSLTFRGSGAGTTILDGQRTFEGREGSILYSIDHTPALDVDGFTFRNGTGARTQEGYVVGGAIGWWMAWNEVRVAIRNCTFEDNSVDNGWLGTAFGGAVAVRRATDLTIADCGFVGNATSYAGGAVAVLGVASAHDLGIVDCRFDIPENQGLTYGGSALYLRGLGRLRVERCELVATGTQSTDLLTEATDIVVENSLFIDRGGINATEIEMLDPPGQTEPHETAIVFRNNVVWNSSGALGRLRVQTNWGEVEVVGNTFVNCDAFVSVGCISLPLSFANNIAHGGHVELYGCSGTASCNDVWPDSVIEGSDEIVRERNISSDPLFCDAPNGDFHIAYESACAPENAPEGCGLIGALPPACGMTPTVETTWGRIRATFR